MSVNKLMYVLTFACFSFMFADYSGKFISQTIQTGLVKIQLSLIKKVTFHLLPDIVLIIFITDFIEAIHSFHLNTEVGSHARYIRYQCFSVKTLETIVVWHKY